MCLERCTRWETGTALTTNVHFIVYPYGINIVMVLLCIILLHFQCTSALQDGPPPLSGGASKDHPLIRPSQRPYFAKFVSDNLLQPRQVIQKRFQPRCAVVRRGHDQGKQEKGSRLLETGKVSQPRK